MTKTETKDTIKIEFNKTKDNILRVLCPAECKTQTRHIVLQSVEQKGRHYYEEDFWVDWQATYQTLECQGCSEISFRAESSNSEDWDPRTGEAIIREELYPKRSKDTLPIKDFSLEVPPKLRRIYREVIDCYNNEILTMCAVGLRSIVEGLCNEMKITDGPVEITTRGKLITIRKKNIEGKIAGLHEKGILTKKESEILHEHRFMGNEAVHELSSPSTEELKLAIEISEHMLDSVFELPEKAKELKFKRTLRNKKAGKI